MYALILAWMARNGLNADSCNDAWLHSVQRQTHALKIPDFRRFFNGSISACQVTTTMEDLQRILQEYDQQSQRGQSIVPVVIHH